MNRTILLSTALFFFGLGISLGKLTHMLWEMGGLKEVFAPQGDYVGYALMTTGFITLIYEHVKLLK